VFEAEDRIVSGDRAVVRWVYRKVRRRDGKVAAKLAYVKG
jgi:hypothetical protein